MSSYSYRMYNIAMVQGAYYLITGLWPLFHIESFEKVTGPKVDIWLVKTVGLLTATIGLFLILTANDQRTNILGVLSAASFAGVDLFYGLRGRISRVYVVDGIIEVFFALIWLWL
ncbi:MAG: hypothetical protein JWL85_85 [Candidatus Saccharibacteria bacterium]|nr:hypothetical protein [Candidatus Saccharibacteria bacterium]